MLSYLAGVVDMAHAQLPEHYAESVMVFALSEDGEVEISLRLARFVLTGKATIWFHIATPEGAWSLADESFETSNNATPVNAEVASFVARRKDQSISFHSAQRQESQMQGKVTGVLNVQPTRHPTLGEGSLPVSIELNYTSDSPGYRSPNGRWEMTGVVTGSVTVNGKTTALRNAGKWHEQTGPRAQFAPAFTYFNVQNKNVALLAIAFAGGVSGYGMLNGKLQTLQAFEIEDSASAPRRFKAVLVDASTQTEQVIAGSARVVQSWSVPIEGQRRPGSAVIVDSSAGKMFGSLNDWQPKP
jgi:hypothetical protein